ncbi:MAG: hypothetical protein WA004_02345 [Saprospiraceae bacterium]
MLTKCFPFCLLLTIFLIADAASAQTTINFDETWKEFLENDKISNMSALAKPDKVYNKPDYAKYLLMNTNTSFCQSDMKDAEKLMEEIRTIDPEILESIPGYVEKKEALEAKIEAYYSMDVIWQRFLQTREVTSEELEAVTAARTSCEKRTLAKYSFMTAHYHLCQGDISKSKDVFENRTLKLIEKTTLRVEDVEGLAQEAGRLKSLYRTLDKLDAAWAAYVKTGVSPGFDVELPLFPCNPIPNMKAMVLNAVLDVCDSGEETLEKIKELQAGSSVGPDESLKAKVKELEAAVKSNDDKLAALNAAWAAFIPDNKVKAFGQYGYDYCTIEPLIRAYIMDGFVFVCETADEMLLKIDSIFEAEDPELESITMVKMNELAAMREVYHSNGVKIEKLWNKFISKGDKLTEKFQTTDLYCDNIHQVKDWTISGLTGDCEAGYLYLEKIETFHESFEFDFTEDVECRIQNLRVKVWNCRYELLRELAEVEAPGDAMEARLAELLEEYGMGERPEVCVPRK